MGSSSLNTPYNNPWTPADAVLRDCSQGICSFYCPQWCSVIYPPPPVPSLTAIGVAAATGDDDADDSSSFRLSPLIVALIGILASAFVLITYYTIISRFCTRRTRIHQNDANQWMNDNDESAIQASSSSSNTGGLDESLIRSITVRKYKKGDGLVEGTDCSVCLSEFQDCESLRLLPKCNHAFHLPCIDTWLRSHSSCPLCRSNIVISNTSSPSSSSGNLPNQRENSQFQEASRTLSVHVSALEHQYRNDAVIVIQGSDEEIQVAFSGNLEERNRSESDQARLLLVADILRNYEDDDEEDVEVEIGSSKENGREMRREK